MTDKAFMKAFTQALGLEEGFGKVEAEKEYLKSAIEEAFSVDVKEGKIKIRDFEIVKQGKMDMIDCIVELQKEFGLDKGKIFDKIAEISDYRGKEAGVEIDVESGVLALVDLVKGAVGDKDEVADILEEVGNVVISAEARDRFRSVYGISGDDDVLDVVVGVYNGLEHRKGRKLANEVLRKWFNKFGTETFLEKEEEQVVAIIEDTGRVVKKDKFTGEIREEKLYENKEEALTELGKEGFE